MTHHSEGTRLHTHYLDDCGGTIEGVLDALANQLYLRANVGGRPDDEHCITRLNGGCWDCEELGRRLDVLTGSVH